MLEILTVFVAAIAECFMSVSGRRSSAPAGACHCAARMLALFRGLPDPQVPSCISCPTVEAKPRLDRIECRASRFEGRSCFGGQVQMQLAPPVKGCRIRLSKSWGSRSARCHPGPLVPSCSKHDSGAQNLSRSHFLHTARSEACLESFGKNRAPFPVPVNSSGAGDGTRTREYQLGKLGPYHLATPA